MSSPLFQVDNKNIFPVFLSITGDGLPHTFVLSSLITIKSPHVFPPSVDLFSTKSISPESDELFFLPSANANTTPESVVMIDGILNVL